MGVEITVTLTGPIFDGRAVRAGHDLVRDLTDRVGQYAIEAVQRNLDTSIKKPTPYYETQIELRETATYERVIDDRGVIYGDWLEGTGSRNQTTRFKGYHSFRRAAQQTQRAVPALSAPIIKRHLNAMGG